MKPIRLLILLLASAGLVRAQGFDAYGGSLDLACPTAGAANTRAAGAALGVTCNTSASATRPTPNAVVAGASFTIPLTEYVTNPGCYNYRVIN